MQVILKNLLENAIRHSHQENVKIRIRTEIDAERRFRGFPRQRTRLSRETRSIWASSFEKGETSHGAGVGLYLVQVLMKRMGGFARFGSANHGRPGFEVSLFFSEALHD